MAHQPSKRVPAKAAQELLSLDDTVAVSAALVALRVGFTIVHVETTGPDPFRDEILAIHALQLDHHRPVAEFNARVPPLRAHVSPEAVGDQADRPPAKRQPAIPLEDAMAGLCRFLGTHRQHVFVHDTAGTQTFLGQAARQYGMRIENPVGDVVDLAKLAWPDRSDYSLPGLASDLVATPEPSDATRAILALLQAASKQLTGRGGRVSSSIVHWGTSADTVRIRQEPW